MTTEIANTNLLKNLLLAIKSDDKDVTQLSIKVIRGDSMVCAAGDNVVIKHSKN